ncbi:MAG: proline--tRNA ligase [Desulfovibrio sp.]|nr:proline--tRNA ligase [Desulfovibrio sp.]
MRFSAAYIPTLKETPADAEVASHQLMLRAGMIRRLSSGLYIYLPLGLRVVERIGAVVRKHMNAAGFQELLLPMVQPAELWMESGRWDQYGKELLRFKDRGERDCCLGPTHEEVVTDLVRDEVRSYRQLPVRLYQIQTKFRDEIRPRFGLMRAREFVMKDAYSFDLDVEAAERSYRAMYDAYVGVFTELGLRFRAVEADNGSIGGNFSHEFMVIADIGEDVVCHCRDCDYAANLERAEVAFGGAATPDACPPTESVSTPGAHTVEAVSSLLGVPPSRLVKTLVLKADDRPVAVLVRGDREANEAKVKRLLGAVSVELADAATVRAVTGAPMGFAGPVGLDIPVYADNELQAGTDYVTGANAPDAHLRHVHLPRDVRVEAFADLRCLTPEDPCPRCGGPMRLTRGIEVGHVFMLGLKYSESMHMVIQDEAGQERFPVMGCYGIGVSRVAAAAIEQNHDADGILFPPPMAPYAVHLLNLDPRKPDVTEVADRIHDLLEASGRDVLLDDRAERPGVKFKDADLMGAPMQLVVGGKGLAAGIVECKDRRTGVKGELPVGDGFLAAFDAWAGEVEDGWRRHRDAAEGSA